MSCCFPCQHFLFTKLPWKWQTNNSCVYFCFQCRQRAGPLNEEEMCSSSICVRADKSLRCHCLLLVRRVDIMDRVQVSANSRLTPQRNHTSVLLLCFPDLHFKFQCYSRNNASKHSNMKYLLCSPRQQQIWFKPNLVSWVVCTGAWSDII